MPYSEKSGELTINERNGDFEGMLKSRTFQILKIDSKNPLGIDERSEKSEQVFYDGSTSGIVLK